MMEIRAINVSSRTDWETQHGDILSFIQQYGVGRIPSDIFRALLKLSPRDLSLPGSSLLTAHIQTEDGPRIAGVCCVKGYGSELCLVVVHPLYRKLGLGTRLLSEQIAALGHLSLRVALGHASSLNMCFRAGLTANRMVKDARGRSWLVLEKGTVSPNDSEASEAKFCKEGDFSCLSPS
ncbi:GNAT family N-acetyltransferase [Paenibacillus puldeungensis]|uniref:GNAT family N-acetyltransferase n=1 Tax=Paenibacillus puldeungensis TaxID=696536 RepID=A0ABW3S0Z3_9BACL